jgi:uncharacterized protein
MKWYLNDLEDITSIDEIIDFSNHIKSIIDLIEIKPTSVRGTLIKVETQVVANLEIKTNIVQACAITLKPVKYDLSFNAVVIFGDDNEADYQLTNPIELTDIIFGYIIAEKPYVIYHEDALKEDKKEESTPHSAFNDLDKL